MGADEKGGACSIIMGCQDGNARRKHYSEKIIKAETENVMDADVAIYTR